MHPKLILSAFPVNEYEAIGQLYLDDGTNRRQFLVASSNSFTLAAAAYAIGAKRITYETLTGTTQFPFYKELEKLNYDRMCRLARRKAVFLLVRDITYDFHAEFSVPEKMTLYGHTQWRIVVEHLPAEFVKRRPVGPALEGFDEAFRRYSALIYPEGDGFAAELRAIQKTLLETSEAV